MNGTSEPRNSGETENACETNEPRVASSISSRVSRVNDVVSGATFSSGGFGSPVSGS